MRLDGKMKEKNINISAEKLFKMLEEHMDSLGWDEGKKDKAIENLCNFINIKNQSINK